MKRNLKFLRFSGLVAMLLLVTAIGFNTVFAADVVPSNQIIGGPPPGDYCSSGSFVQFPIFRNVQGFGSSYVSIRSDSNVFGGSTRELDYDATNLVVYGMNWMGVQVNHFYTSNTYLNITIDTYQLPHNQGPRTYTSTMRFYCPTGMLAGFTNQAYPDGQISVDGDLANAINDAVEEAMPDASRPTIEVNPDRPILIVTPPPAGPSIELPGDIVTIPGINVAPR